jgi:OOP family OmpA-OmpF porin
MKNLQLYLFIALCLAVTLVSAQESMELTAKDSIVKSSWVLGLGINIVDDTASPFSGNILDIKDSWNAAPYPSSISIARNFSNGVGLKAVGSYNKYKAGKLIDGQINMVERDYYAIDGMVSYDLNKLFGETGWFDPFLQAGAGYSSIGDTGRTTGNAGFGFNTWFNDNWGLNFNTMGKWGLKEGDTRQIQHSAGVVYRFGVEKELSKKGMDQLALIEAMTQEQQRVQDSTDSVDRAKELAKRMAEELEASRLAAAEKARIDAENKRRAQIESDIENLGKIYFAFNSSALNTESKATLTQLVTLMDTTPTITLEVASYTDSRGAANYNLGLSERRVKSTVDYLLEKGLNEKRLIPKALGETNLVNECDDNTPCSAAKHRLNRRSEFIVIGF